MNDDDLGAQLAGVLHELGERPVPAASFDAAALRRRGDIRRARRQAARASSASAMVFVVAIGCVFYAAHKSRTRSLDVSVMPAYSSPRGAYTSELTLLTTEPTAHAVAGVPATVTYDLTGDGQARITKILYGDGAGLDVCAMTEPGGVPTGSFTHVWTAPGTYAYRLQAADGCPAVDPVTATGTVVVTAPEPHAPGSTLVPAVP